jgi:hypothetical protein
MNVDTPTRKCTIHVEGCTYEVNKKDTLYKGIAEIKRDGGWLHFSTIQETINHFQDRWASSGYQLSRCACLECDEETLSVQENIESKSNVLSADKLTNEQVLTQLAKLLEKKQLVDAEIKQLIRKQCGIGNFIISRILGITLEASLWKRREEHIDGVFSSGVLAGKTVKINLDIAHEFRGKVSSMRGSVLNGELTVFWHNLADYYLVVNGLQSWEKLHLKDTFRAKFDISHIYLFEMKELAEKLEARELKGGVFTKIKPKYWQESEIYPVNRNQEIALTNDQVSMLKQFARWILLEWLP